MHIPLQGSVLQHAQSSAMCKSGEESGRQSAQDLFPVIVKVCAGVVCTACFRLTPALAICHAYGAQS